MAMQAGALAAKPEALSRILGTYLLQGKYLVPQVVL